MRSSLDNIHLLVSDVDGVLTDGSVTYGHEMLELKSFNTRDGLGIKLAGWAGLPIILLTGRKSAAVTRRAEELGVAVMQGAGDKAASLRDISEYYSVPLAEIAYIGDDLNDLPALRIAGVAIAVADAVAEVRMIAHHVTTACGGNGAIREVIEEILQLQGKWETAIEVYLQKITGNEVGQ